jgi:tetratricopeptide (TPR) repeat protein
VPTVFLSYSHQDERWKNRVAAALAALGLEADLEVWDDRRIAAGDGWLAEIEAAMNRASVAVLLVSTDFLASRFIRGTEVPHLLNRRQKEGLRIIPLFVRPSPWEAVDWLAAIQGLPTDAKPLSTLRKHQADQHLSTFAKEVRSSLTAPTASPLSRGKGERWERGPGGEVPPRLSLGLQAERQPGYPRLYSLAGYRYCDLLLSRGEPEAFEEVRGRAEETLKWVTPMNWLLDIALDHLSLGRAHLGQGDFAKAADHLDQAVEGLRRAGQEDDLPRGLLARAALWRLQENWPASEADLSEAMEIAERGLIRRHECDAHLEWARVCRDREDRAGLERHVARARKIVDGGGRWRRWSPSPPAPLPSHSRPPGEGSKTGGCLPIRLRALRAGGWPGGFDAKTP